jgi:NAD(P)-dependent dehydrogenase (short-subunit alcohol dehydrogenase family)
MEEGTVSELGRGAVVVTGASTGIGRATALHLDRLGFRVFAGVRREPDAESLRRDGSPRLEPVRIDVTEAKSLAAAAARVAGETGDAGLAGVVANAGIGLGGPLEFVPLDDLRRQLEVNVVGVVATLQAFLPAVRRARGRVIIVGSNSGRLAAPFAGPYAASKFAVEAIADSLRVELRPHGVQVALIEPGAIATPIWDKTQRYADEAMAQMPEEAKRLYAEGLATVLRSLEQSARGALPPERCARAIEHALTARRPRTRYPVGAEAWISTLVARFVPDRIRDRLITKILAG